MKNLKQIFIFLSIFSILALPVFSLAYEIKAEKGGLADENGGTADKNGWLGLVPCGRVSISEDSVNKDAAGTVENPCGFNDLMDLVNNIIHFILFYFAVPVAAIMFFYAGFLLVTAGGEAASARTKAKSIFLNALVGLVIAVAAFLIVRTVLSFLGYHGGWIGFGSVTI